MTRWPRLSSAAALVRLGIVVGLMACNRAAAQSTPPCRTGDSVLSLGKAAFFRSIERGAFAIGERTLEDLTDGLGGAGASKSPSNAKRAHPTAPAQARAVVFPPAADAALVGALAAYVDSPSSDTADAAFQSSLLAATKILFETPPAASEAGHVGLVLEGGQFFNKSSTFAVQEMTNESKRGKLEDSLFGGGPDLRMGGLNKVLSEAPFFKAPVIADTRNVDRNNLGLAVRKEQELRTLWFDDYRAYLATALPARPAAQIADALNAGWPVLQKFWAFKRTEIFVDRALAAFGTEMRQVNERVAAENLPRQDCDPKGR